jgi:hypothetical protein
MADEGNTCLGDAAVQQNAYMENLGPSTSSDAHVEAHQDVELHTARDFKLIVDEEDTEEPKVRWRLGRGTHMLRVTSVFAVVLAVIAICAVASLRAGTKGDMNRKISARPAVPDATLFCWVVSKNYGPEAELVQHAFDTQASIFACNKWTVFSDNWKVLSVPAKNIGGLQVPVGAWGSWVNGPVFARAWQRLMAEGLYKDFDWTVKADPDCVWFPDRLRARLWKNSWDLVAVRQNRIASGEMFLGPIEVFSRATVQKFSDTPHVCDWDQCGEDGWIHGCMRNLIGEQAVLPEDFLLNACAEDDAGCCDDGAYVAFHAFKSPQTFTACRSASL